MTINNDKKYSISIATTCWLLLSSVVIAIVAFCHFPDDADWKWCIPLEGRAHIPMMLCGVASVALIAFVCIRCCRTKEIRRLRLLLITSILTVVQCAMVYSYYVYTDWDVQQLTGAAQAMAEGRPTDDFQWYFHWAPNNLFLTRIFAFVFFISGPLWGLKTTLFPLLALQSIGAGLTALMLFQTAIHIWGEKKYAVTVYTFYLLLVWFSPWWSIPYSDIWGLMVTVVLLWLTTTLPFRHRWVKLLIVGATTALAYYIRPQTVFVPMALGLVYLFKNRNFKKLLPRIAILAGGIATGILLAHLAVAGSGMHLHTSEGFGSTHYLMLGANYQSIGIYSAQDVDFSRSFPKKRERQRAEINETKRRYKALGVKGTLTLWGRKNLLNFSDGTFYWGREGEFYKIIPERDGRLSQVTRNIFYNRVNKGSLNDAWTVAMTSLWFGILVFTFVAAWPRRTKSNGLHNTFVIDAILLSVTMLTLFHTLCEARARYLFCFLPLFILLAVDGLQTLFKKSQTP